MTSIWRIIKTSSVKNLLSRLQWIWLTSTRYLTNGTVVLISLRSSIKYHFDQKLGNEKCNLLKLIINLSK